MQISTSTNKAMHRLLENLALIQPRTSLGKDPKADYLRTPFLLMRLRPLSINARRSPATRPCGVLFIETRGEVPSESLIPGPSNWNC